jgi:hypothetical protein
MSSSSSDDSYPVQLAIYDLSRGAVQALSAQFLGPQYHIQAVPHTGVVVFGKEYFFGGGIQCEEPTSLRQMMQMVPMQIVNVGRTRVSQAQFDAWCSLKMQTGEFSMESYDLLSHNCNTFSHAALKEGLQLSQGVPQWVLDVPRIFLSSPLGQMVRPMLDNMQLGQVSGAHTVPSATSAATASVLPPNVSTTSGHNPWAQMTQPPSNPSPISTSNNNTYPILESHNKPLIANETKTVAMCVQKLVDLTETDKESQALHAVGQSLMDTNKSDTTAQVSVVATFLVRCLTKGHKTSFVLMLLRVLVLHYLEQCSLVITWLQQALLTSSDAVKSPAARAMAWLTVSNIVAKTLDPATTTPLESLVDLAVQDIHPEVQGRVEVRQAAAAFLYNTVLTLSSSKAALPSSSSSAEEEEGHKEEEESLSDMHVSILCGTLESVQNETDETVRLRRLLAGGRLIIRAIKSTHTAAVQLVNDLGFADGLQVLAETFKKEKSALLAKELLDLLQ